MKNKLGVLLTNIGSPEEPTSKAVRHYLKKFLTDPRVVEIPKLIWLPILHGIILRTRPKKSAALYKKIWTAQGSPLNTISNELSRKLTHSLQMPVFMGMHYGEPTIEAALHKLQAKGVTHLVVLPLYPQYSATTTAVTFDQVTAALKKQRHIPNVSFIQNYYTDPSYIDAICHSIQQHNIEHLLFSFHGLPERFVAHGDPYADECKETVRLIAQQLNLPKDKYTISFQSRIGKAKWLRPYTDEILQTLPKNNIKNLHVICPGFAIDCLETLEEISIRGREQFLNAGGKTFHYIPALNENSHHIELLKKIILKKPL